MANASDLAKKSETTPRRTLSVRVYHDYGSVHVEFGVAAECNPENELDQVRIWQNLLAQVNDMHEDWAKHELPNIGLPPVEKQIEPPTSGKNEKPVYHQPVNEVFEYEALEIYWDKPTDCYKLRTRGESTPYKKFGALIPPELADENDLKNQVGESNWFLPMNVLVKISNGRVVSIGDTT